MLLPRPSSVRPFVLVLALALCASVSPLAAWGPTAHRVIGQIATDHLGDAARREVRALLGTSLAEASTWADEVRDDPRWEWLDPYHFVNLDPAVGRFERCPQRGCLVDGLERAIERLRDPGASRSERAVALRQLVHFAGDLHQPLHVSHAEDRGGNQIDVEWFGQPASLHWVWDTGIVRVALGRSWSGIAAQLEADQLADGAREREWRSGTIRDWVHESYRLSVEVVYPSLADGRRLGREYAATHAKLVETQLAKAGIRLAWLLDQIWR